MQYREILQKQIRELEQKIATTKDEKSELEKQLNKLKLSEFEEDMREENQIRLLKG